jgi:hypothetical protein
MNKKKKRIQSNIYKTCNFARKDQWKYFLKNCEIRKNKTRNWL